MNFHVSNLAWTIDAIVTLALVVMVIISLRHKPDGLCEKHKEKKRLTFSDQKLNNVEGREKTLPIRVHQLQCPTCERERSEQGTLNSTTVPIR